MLQESIALGTLEDHVRGPQRLPQVPGTCQVPAQRRLAGDVQAGTKPPLPRGQQRDLHQRMKISQTHEISHQPQDARLEDACSALILPYHNLHHRGAMHKGVNPLSTPPKNP